MSPTSANALRSPSGFTLTEVLVATAVSGIVMAAMLSAYLFLGRSLGRLDNLQQQEVQSRRTLTWFTRDLSAAIQLTSANAGGFTVTNPSATGNATITYTYSPDTGTLVRTDAGGQKTLLSGVTSLTLTYYNKSGAVIAPGPQSVKTIELAFTTAAGDPAAGTRASSTSVSARVALRNRTTLQ